MVMGVTVACAFIVLGLVPGLCQQFADSISDLTNMLSYTFPIPPRSRSKIGQPHWFALVGVALAALTVLMYLER